MEIVQYSKDLYDKIISFNKESFPLRKGVEDSFERRFNVNVFGNYLDKTFYVVDEKKDIYGQFLIMANRFHYNQHTYEGGWGFDFIINEKLRGQKKGKLLANKVINTHNYCVLGVSKASEHLHYKFGNKKIGEAYRYIRFLNPLSPIRLIFKKNNFNKYKVKYPETLSIKNKVFTKVTNVEMLPNRAFWNYQRLEWDRSTEFLKWRFFEKDNKYAFYININKDLYFVVRKVRWKNLNTLLLVDYRYTTKNGFKDIYNSVLKIANQLDCSAVICLSSDENEQSILKKKMNIKFGDSLLIMTTCKEVENAEKVSVTFADSDADNFYGDNEW